MLFGGLLFRFQPELLDGGRLISCAALTYSVFSLCCANELELFAKTHHSGETMTRDKVSMKKIKQFFETEDLFAQHTGIELIEVKPGWARASMKIEPFHYNGAKTVHGGAIFTLADFTFAVASNSHGTLAMGINTSVSFVKAATRGTLYAVATEQALNHRLASYLVQVTDDEKDVVAIFQGMVYRKNRPIIPADYG